MDAHEFGVDEPAIRVSGTEEAVLRLLFKKTYVEPPRHYKDGDGMHEKNVNSRRSKGQGLS